MKTLFIFSKTCSFRESDIGYNILIFMKLGGFQSALSDRGHQFYQQHPWFISPQKFHSFRLVCVDRTATFTFCPHHLSLRGKPCYIFGEWQWLKFCVCNICVFVWVIDRSIHWPLKDCRIKICCRYSKTVSDKIINEWHHWTEQCCLQ